MSDLRPEIARARQLFEFLKEFAQQRLPKQRTIGQHSWVLRLRDLPSQPAISVGEVLLSEDGDSDATDEALLTVRKPKLTNPPQPPRDIRDWLLDGWRDPENVAEVIPGQNVTHYGNTVTERFGDNPQRSTAFSVWKMERDRWAEAERPARAAMQIFERLYALLGRIELESERVELILGDGRLRWRDGAGLIDHPILLQRVELVFDTAHNEFRVVDADRPPELYGTILSADDRITPDRYSKLRELLEQGGFHPLAGAETTGFLKHLAAALGPRAEFVDIAPTQMDQREALLWRDPHLFLRQRQPGFAEAFDRILSGLGPDSRLPSALTRLVGVDTEPVLDGMQSGRGDGSDSWSEPADIYLSKPANKEQIGIVRALERNNSVLVQGPPGTGKSHTIANLIGHLVASGNRILVTSHTTKALSVLRGQVVESLQPLCVAALENDLAGRAQLEQSVRGILARISENTEDELAREAGDIAVQRVQIRTEIESIVADLRKARSSEYEKILVSGQAFDPAEAAQWVKANQEGNDWIPGPLEGSAPIPLDIADLVALYESNVRISKEEESELDDWLPEPDELRTPEDFAALVAEDQFAVPSDASLPWSHPAIESDLPALEKLLTFLTDSAGSLREFSPWQLAIIGDGYTGGAVAERWSDLARLVEESRERYDRLYTVLLHHDVENIPEGTHAQLRAVVGEIREHVAAKKKLDTLGLLFRPKWRRFLAGSRVNGLEPRDGETLQAVDAHLELAEGRARLVQRWNKVAAGTGLPTGESLGEPVELALQELSRQFEGLAVWWHEQWRQLEELAGQVGLVLDRIRDSATGRDASLAGFSLGRSLLMEQLPQAVEVRLAAVRQIRANRLLEEYVKFLRQGHGPAVASCLDAIHDRDLAKYTQSFGAILQLSAKRNLLGARRTLLSRLRPVAPRWAAAIGSREGLHGESCTPGDPTIAWRWTQLKQEIDYRSSLDEARLSARLRGSQERLRESTSELVDRKAWLGQVRRVKLPQQQALQGWANLQKKIGKGTGKRAPKLQAEARKRLAEAQDAVPVWIMPLNRVAETIDPLNSRFDVVIIDEASQSDVTGLLAWFLADQILVVGDDKQVSPLAVGQKLEGVETLINTFLAGIPNNQSYDGMTSIYELAQQCFGGTIRLREHFRCMPDIIEFSNELSYDFEIQPLRNPYAARAPHVVEQVVAGSSRDGKTNPAEARSMAATIAAILEDDEYAGKTVGAITLLGDEQAHLIWTELARIVEPKALEDRRFVAGNAAQFQGDERDVIFLSMVDVPGTDGPLRLREGELFKQRYNVAVSRAKDQVWLFHSLDPGHDLKQGDLRRQLIDYFRAPGARGQAAARAVKRAESPFEVDVIRRLIAAGYQVEPQVKVGSYRIDVVVKGSDGQVALECDGARFHPPEKVPEDLERQAILERSGWRFVRIRSTAFFSDPDKSMADVFRQLSALGVEPGFTSEPELVSPVDLVIERIRRRAWEIMRERGWVEPVEPS
ncbi:MAG: AAA domain-containing protein [Gemmatimonadales bacterium]|nr:AAA domain-containing protein [Gemmatimonadales bacterium]MDZ4388658.1 AAA domain-containing protein [Gemmatimonadales bacterium]